MLSNVKSRTLLAKTPKTHVAFNDHFKKGILFIPMIISGGFLYSTSNGLTNLNNFDTNDFTWMEIIADGQGDLQVCWEGSTSIQTNKEIIQNDVIGKEHELTTNATITYQVGKYGWGFTSDLNSSFDIKQDVSYNDFNVMFQSDEVSLIVKAEDCVGIDFKKFRFYCLPEVGKKKIFYISSLIEHRDINNSSKVISYDITFTHITNKLQKSGKAIEEYFHFSSPGMGYTWPIVDRENKVIKLDNNLIQSNGINLIKEEEFNAAIHNNTAFIGWEIKEDSNNNWVGDITNVKDNGDGTYSQTFYAPKEILPHTFSSAESSILARRALPESDIAFINNINFTEDKYDTWTNYWTQLFSNDFSDKYAGECSYNGRQDIGDYNKLNENFNLGKSTYNQSGIYNFKVAKDFSINLTDVSWKDINMFNYFCCKDIYTLPFAFEYHILNQPKQWPIIGGIFSALTGGYGFGWDETTRRISDKTNILKDICGICSSTMIDIAQKNWKIKDKTENKFFINDFYKKNSDDRFNANNRSLILSYQLSSDLETTNTYSIDKTNLNTAWLGQNQIWDGISKTSDGKKILKAINEEQSNLVLDGTFRLKTNDNLSKKYIICGISNQTCFAESQKYTFYNYTTPIWTGAFLTNSNFRDNSRDWTNWYNLNSLANLPMTGDKIEYPYDNSTSNIDSIIRITNINQDICNIKSSFEESKKAEGGKISFIKKEFNSDFFASSKIDGHRIFAETKTQQTTFNFNISFNEDISSSNDLLNMLINKLNKEGISIKLKQEVGGPLNKYKKVYTSSIYPAQSVKFSDEEDLISNTDYFYIKPNWVLEEDKIVSNDVLSNELQYQYFGSMKEYRINDDRVNIENTKYMIDIEGTNIKINYINLIRKTANIEFNLNLKEHFIIWVNKEPEEVIKNINKIGFKDTSDNYFYNVLWIPDSYSIPQVVRITSNWKVSNILEEVMISN